MSKRYALHTSLCSQLLEDMLGKWHDGVGCAALQPWAHLYICHTLRHAKPLCATAQVGSTLGEWRRERDSQVSTVGLSHLSLVGPHSLSVVAFMQVRRGCITNCSTSPSHTSCMQGAHHLYLLTTCFVGLHSSLRHCVVAPPSAASLSEHASSDLVITYMTITGYLDITGVPAVHVGTCGCSTLSPVAACSSMLCCA